MKKIFTIITFAVAALLGYSCAKPAAEFIHDDPTISEIYIVIEAGKNGWKTSDQITGVINDETGEILFPIPRKKASLFDPKAVFVKANVGYDTYITPSLTGLKDLSSPYKIKVTCSQTGSSKEYTLEAYYSRD